MSRKILLLSLVMAFLLSGCSWHVPFFGSDKVEPDKPLVQDSAQVDEAPQYSGQLQAPNPDMNQYQQPAATNVAPYGQQAPAYGQPPAAAYGQTGAAPAFQAGQPYNPNTNYALNASPGAYGAPANTPTGTNLNNSQAPGSLSSANGSYFGSAQNEDQVFVGIKRKALYIISYPQRGLTTTPQDQFSQNIYQQLAQSPGINLVPKETIDRYNDAHKSFSQSSSDTSAWLSRMGQALGAQAIILEKVSFANNLSSGAYAPPTQQVELQLIDTATGYPVKSYNLTPSTQGAAQVINNLTNHVRMIDWSARVIKVEKKRILINAGRFSGLQTGQNLRVYAKGREIKDPNSKLSLGKAQGVLKGTVKIIDFFGLDGAICEPLTTGNKFKLDDMVKAAE